MSGHAWQWHSSEAGGGAAAAWPWWEQAFAQLESRLSLQASGVNNEGSDVGGVGIITMAATLHTPSRTGPACESHNVGL